MSDIKSINSSNIVANSRYSHPEEDGLRSVMILAAVSIWRYRLPILIWIFFTVLCSFVYLHNTMPTYTASANLILEPRRAASNGTNQDGITLDLARAESELQVLKSERLLSHVFSALNLENVPELKISPVGLYNTLKHEFARFGKADEPRPSNVEELRQIIFMAFTGRVGVRRIGQSYVFEISYTSTSPDLAQKIANSIACTYIWQSLSNKADQARNGGEIIQGRLNALATQVKVAAAGSEKGTFPEGPTPDADARIISVALQPLSPSAPNKLLVLSVGVVFGSLTGLFALFVFLSFDQRIYSSKQLRMMGGVPFLGSVPALRQARGSRNQIGITSLVASQPRLPFSLAVRNLKTSIYLETKRRSNDDFYSLAVTSGTDGSGVSTICAALAFMMKQAGTPVTLITTVADKSESPKEFSFFKLSNLERSGQLCDQDLRKLKQDLQGISFYPGLIPTEDVDVSSFLGSADFYSIIALEKKSSVVIVDLPPLRKNGDVRSAAAKCDFVLFVVDRARTDLETVRTSFDSLSDAGACVIGTVLNKSVVADS
ncbi:Wzz/FepE/Etk N-terminal domain-containing protein [Methylobacterium sp.]|uniref:Wzz/FepE/Etk N-terminal domain-containing protein n=1 Tax=Methylobacterium sp. TaxID=409 RepID=UPI003B004C47